TQHNAAIDDQTTAASHSLAQEAQSLQASVARFKVGSAAQVAAAPARAPAPAPAPSAPAKPAHRMVQALKTLGRGGAAPAPAQQAAPAEDGWEEF
ncbi:MAG: methyl-accepting chemotaxis protein, partial [Brevundimonas aurantiaca]